MRKKLAPLLFFCLSLQHSRIVYNSACSCCYDRVDPVGQAKVSDRKYLAWLAILEGDPTIAKE